MKKQNKITADNDSVQSSSTTNKILYKTYQKVLHVSDLF